MEKSKQITTKMAKVMQILTSLPEARDNDRILIDAYWRYEQPLLFNFQSGNAVSRAFINGDLSMPDDITRTRRKVQELYPALRGSRWVQSRRRDNEADVRTHINTV